MKNMRILQGGILCAALAGFQAQGALLTTGQDPGSPYYADFAETKMNINYNFSAGSGVFTATSTVTADNAYSSGTDSAGTHGAYNGTGFNGSYSLTAHVHYVAADNQYEVYGTGNTFTIEGSLLGKGNADVLLSGNLATGANSIGYGASTTQIFDFLFTPASGEAAIMADFFGTSGRGAIILTTGSYLTSYSDLSHNFQNASQGKVDTFVPEPGVYSLAGSIMALVCLSLGRKKNVRLAV